MDKLNESEFRELAILLKRFVSTELDQWDHWSVDTPFGKVFIDISRKSTGLESDYFPLEQAIEKNS
ncbi:hypothetical protein NBRC116494_11840 [Aurantivibrio plasticivorans]